MGTGAPAIDAALDAWLGCAVLLALRLAPLVLLAPWLAAGYAPRLVQLAITACLVVCLLPIAATPEALALPATIAGYALLGLRELLIGLVLGVAFALPVLAVRWAGELIGVGVGGAASEHGAPWPELHGLTAAALFVTLGGHRLVLAGLARSLSRAPLAVPALPGDASDIVLGSAALLGDAIVTAVLIALPVLLALALADALLALFGRLTALMFLPELSGASRALLTLAVVWMGLAALVGSLPAWFDAALSRALELWSAP